MERRERPKEEPKREYFSFLWSYLDALYELDSGQDQMDALFSILEYAIYGIEPKDASGIVRTAFRLVKPNVDKSIERAETNKRNGLKPKRARSEREANESEREANEKRIKASKERIEGGIQ